MYIYICVSMYIYIPIYVYIYLYIYIYVYRHTYLYRHISIQNCAMFSTSGHIIRGRWVKPLWVAPWPKP